MPIQVQHLRNAEFEPMEPPRLISGMETATGNYWKSHLHIFQGLAKDPVHTFYFEVDSDEMALFGIKTGTLLVVDCSRIPTGGMLVIAWQKEEWLVRQLLIHGTKKLLTTGKENDEFVEVNHASGILIWGVVTWSCCPQLEV